MEFTDSRRQLKILARYNYSLSHSPKLSGKFKKKEKMSSGVRMRDRGQERGFEVKG